MNVMRATIHDEAAATARDMARRPLRPLIRSQQIQINTTEVFAGRIADAGADEGVRVSRA
jgi:hypothetical protein